MITLVASRIDDIHNPGEIVIKGLTDPDPCNRNQALWVVGIKKPGLYSPPVPLILPLFVKMMIH